MQTRCLYRGRPATAKQIEGTDTGMKIATWNLARVLPKNRARHAAILDWLHHIDADVWVLTETHDSVSPGPGYVAVTTGEPDRRGAPGERWTTIWSRFPIVPLRPTCDEARAVAALVTLPDGAPLVVYGTVLPWLGSPWRGIPTRGGEAYGAALAAQRADWVNLRSQHPAAHLCVVGDLNQDLSERHYYGSRRNRQALRDVLRDMGLLALTADPGDPVRAVAPTHASIDHICVPATMAGSASARLTVWPEGSVPDRHLSDHFGVVAEIERR